VRACVFVFVRALWRVELLYGFAFVIDRLPVQPPRLFRKIGDNFKWENQGKSVNHLKQYFKVTYWNFTSFSLLTMKFHLNFHITKRL